MARRTGAQIDGGATEKLEIAAAKEELSILEKMAGGLSAKISDLMRQRPQFDRRNEAVEFALHERRQSSLKGYNELAHQCYGRTVIGEEVDEDGCSVATFSYRLTQANVGYIEGDCNVLARNSPIASKLVTANPDDEVEVNFPKRTRFLRAKQVRTFDGPVSLLSPSRSPNFRLMAVRLSGSKKQLLVRNLRAFLGALSTGQPPIGINTGAFSSLPEADAGPREPPKLPEATSVPTTSLEVDPTWFANWKDVYLGDSETTSLGHLFFTQTTRAQESALNNPRGLTFVEGVAGSGKTSVALGRLKFFSNFSTGEELDHYELRNAPLKDFSPEGMVGFVLSHSLKRYLKDTATELRLEHLPIRDFQEFRTDLSNQFGLTQKFKRSKAEFHPTRARLPWLLALDAAVVRVVGLKLKEIALKTADLPTSVRDVVQRIATELMEVQVDARAARFHSAGLAQRIAVVVTRAEFRSREAALRQQMSRATQRRERVDLENALLRFRQEEERQPLSPSARRLLALVNIGDLIIPAVSLQEFPALVGESFGSASDAALTSTLEDSVGALRALFATDEGERSSLTDVDLAAFLAIAVMLADGFEYPDAPSHLYQARVNTAVFIDEVQDFTEIEILLMGLTATSKYSQITLSGDRCQRLQPTGAERYERLFPFVPRAGQNAQIFLEHNFRQRGPIAKLSAGIRCLLQEDRRIAFETADTTSPAPIYTFGLRSVMAQFILHRILTVDPYATIAVIAPSGEEARCWYDLLHDDLSAYHRPALLSHRDDLTRRIDIHFAEVRETKGLEFDVVVIPDAGSFRLETTIGRNQLYVAVSRAKYALLLGCDERASDVAELRQLASANLVNFEKMPSFLMN